MAIEAARLEIVVDADTKAAESGLRATEQAMSRLSQATGMANFDGLSGDLARAGVAAQQAQQQFQAMARVIGDDALTRAAFPELARQVDATTARFQELANGARTSLGVIDSSAGKATASMGRLESASSRGRVAMSGFADSVSPVPLSMTGVGIAAGIAAVSVAKLGKASFDAASDMAEAQNRVDVVFGNSAESIEQFADSAAENLGLSESAALSASGQFGNLFVTMGMGQRHAGLMSEGIVQLAADLGSFNNLPTAKVLDDIQGALIGEMDAIQRLGVNISAADIQQKAFNMGLADTKAQLTPAIKAQATYALIVEQTATAQGDYARTADGAANSVKTARASVADLQATLGGALVPAIGSAAQATTGLVSDLNALAQAAGKAIDAMGGSDGGSKWMTIRDGIGMVIPGNPVQNWNTITDAARGYTVAMQEAAPAIQVTTRDIDLIAAATIAATMEARKGAGGAEEYSSMLYTLSTAASQAADQQALYEGALRRQAEAAGTANERNSEMALGLELGSGAAASAAFNLDKLAEAAQNAWAGQQNLNTSFAQAGSDVAFWESNLSNAESALKILDGEMAENGTLTAEQQVQYDKLTTAVGRYKGGVEDTEGAVVDSTVAQYDFIAAQDDLNGKLASGEISAADYARGMAGLTAETDPAASSAFNMSAAQQVVADTLVTVVGKITDLLVALGLIPPEASTDISTPGVEDAKTNVGLLGEGIGALPTSFTITAYVDTGPAREAIEGLSGWIPRSPAKEGPLAFTPDWNYLVEGIPTAMSAGIQSVVDGGSAITAMIRAQANAQINASHAAYQASGKAMADALVAGFGKGTYDLDAAVASISTDALAALSQMQQELASEIDLGRIAGMDAEEIASLQAQLDAVTGIITAWAAQTGVTVTEALDAAAVGPAVVQGWMDLVGDLDALLSGELTTGLSQQLRDIQAQIQFALAAGAPAEVIAQLQANLAAVQAEYEMAGAAYSAAIQAGMVAGWTTEGAAAVADKIKGVLDGTLMPQLEAQLAELNNLIAFGTAQGWAPELLAIYEQQAAEISDDLAQVSEDMALAAANGLLSDEALAEWNKALGIITEIPLSELAKLLPKMSDGGKNLIDEITQGVMDGTTSMDAALAFLIDMSKKSLSDFTDTNDVAVADIIAELQKLEDALVVDLAEALIAGTDPSAIEANLAAIAAMLRNLQEETKKTVSALDTLPHNTGGNFSGAGGRGLGTRRGPTMSPDSGTIFMQSGGAAQPVTIINQNTFQVDGQELAQHQSQYTLRTLAGQLSSGVTS